MFHVQIALCLLWASLISQLVKNPPQCRFNSWVGEIPWRRERLRIQYSGLENSMDCIVPWGGKKLDRTERLHFHIAYGTVVSDITEAKPCNRLEKLGSCFMYTVEA